MTHTHFVSIQPRDPLIARDGRPFGEDSGNRMRSLDWPLPSAAAGSLRTLLGRMHSGTFDAPTIAALKHVACRGPLPVSGDELFVPASHDLVSNRSSKPLSLRPVSFPADCGADLPDGLQPVLASQPIGKTGSVPAWWSMTKMAEWLLTKLDASSNFFANQTQFRAAAAHDERTHLKIKPATLASEDGMLFSTTGLVLDELREPVQSGTAPRHEASLAMAASEDLASPLTAAWAKLPSLQPFGGERRVAKFSEVAASASLWACPPKVKTELVKIQSGSRLRMVLASPAIFSGGWRPGWLDAASLIGSPPGLPSGTTLSLRLIAVANQRWDAVSGWSYEPLASTGKPGPKAIRRLVPAGGVYFFEVVSAVNVNWDDLWLAPVSDGDQDRRDGFGLSMWGIWDERKGAI